MLVITRGYPGCSPPFPSFPRPEERQFAHVQLATLVSKDPWALVRIGLGFLWYEG